MEKMQWRQQQELAEVKHNADLLMMELRQTVEAEKQKVFENRLELFALQLQPFDGVPS